MVRRPEGAGPDKSGHDEPATIAERSATIFEKITTSERSGDNQQRSQSVLDQAEGRVIGDPLRAVELRDVN